MSVELSLLLKHIFSGGGDKPILSQKLDWKASSKVGSTDNKKHKPGGGQIKVIDIQIQM